MPRDLDPATVLQRVLVLERRQGFEDRAAVGGLERFVRQQLVRGNGSLPLVRSAAEILAGYGSANRREREQAVARALNALLTRTPTTPPTSTQEPAGPPPTNPQADSPPKPRLSVVRSPEELEKPAGSVRGIGKTTERVLQGLGVQTVRDLLYYFPRAHYDYTDTGTISRLKVGAPATLVGTIEHVRNNARGRNYIITTATISDDSGRIAVRWFNQPYLQQRLPIGARIAITGEADVFQGLVSFKPRDYEIIESADLTHAGRLVPVYPLTKGLFQRSLRQLLRRVVEEYSTAIEDYLPAGLREELRLPRLEAAIRQYHFPDDEDSKQWAQQRLAFDELLLIQLGLLLRKQEWQQPIPGVGIPRSGPLLHHFVASLPFALTKAQERVIDEIVRDMSRDVPMSRLLQGDVGSGKTVVAAAALLQSASSGRQGALMAPTEILAEQHFHSVSALLTPFGIRTELLIGSTPRSKRRDVQEAVTSGDVQVLVGTHALIQEDVSFARLGVAITDEQHRFGVEQRALLRQKGLHPHVLSMTATPIPRTLAMTIYGDLDVSVIDEMPPGRTPVITTWSRAAHDAYGVVRDEIHKGHQAFVICPVIEESQEIDMRSAIAEHKELQELIFPDVRVGLLHGRMKTKEKDSVLAAFRNGEFAILVATSVVEVGIDVPNATAMVIRDAHRFGLAQLHQFRGRVGRGGDQAFCVLLSETEGEEARERLEALTATENGFQLAEEDLRLRGPGEFWGVRQSGLPELRVATLGDLPTIEIARRAGEEILSGDPDLSAPENELLRHQVTRFWHDAAELN